MTKDTKILNETTRKIIRLAQRWQNQADELANHPHSKESLEGKSLTLEYYDGRVISLTQCVIDVLKAFREAEEELNNKNQSL